MIDEGAGAAQLASASSCCWWHTSTWGSRAVTTQQTGSNSTTDAKKNQADESGTWYTLKACNPTSDYIPLQDLSPSPQPQSHFLFAIILPIGPTLCPGTLPNQPLAMLRKIIPAAQIDTMKRHTVGLSHLTHSPPPCGCPHNKPLLTPHSPPGNVLGVGSCRPIGTLNRHTRWSTFHSRISLLQVDATRRPLPDRLVTKELC